MTHPPSVRRLPVQWVAMLFGIGFLIVGVTGFIPVTTLDLPSTMPAAAGSDALRLHTEQVSTLRNVVHVIYGVAGIVTSYGASVSTGYLLIGGVVLWLFGLALPNAPLPSYMPPAANGNWVQFLVGSAMVVAAFALQLLQRGVRARRRGTVS